jgi:hypothetical protein
MQHNPTKEVGRGRELLKIFVILTNLAGSRTRGRYPATDPFTVNMCCQLNFWFTRLVENPGDHKSIAGE